MLWYKAWLETRWRFLAGMAVLLAFAALVVFAQPATANVELPKLEGWLGEAVRRAAELMSTYPGYVWSQWFGKNLLQLWTVWAVLVGVGGLANEAARGSALWTLSLPVTRRRLLAVRAGMGALELLALAVVPSLAVCALSPLIGQSYSPAQALAYSLMLFAGGSFFYALSLLLSSVFSDQLKPIILGLSAAVVMAVLSLLSPRLADYNIYGVMSGQKFFTEGALPWAGLAACVAAAAAMFYASLRVIERRDF